MASVPLSIPLAATGALVGAAYLNARFSLTHDALFFRIHASLLFRLFRAGRVGRINFFYVLEERALGGDKARPFILFEGRSYSYAETYERVLRYGAWLRERHGVREGNVVAIDFQNSDTYVFLWFALWAIGARPAFINHHVQGAAALGHCLRASGARLALVDPLVAAAATDEQVRREVPGMELLVFTPEIEAEAQAQAPVRYPDSVRTETEPFNMAILIYTSGTTGLPKPAIVSWAKVHMAATMVTKGTCSGPEDVIYTCMPLYHSAASCLAVCSAIFIGATAAIGRRFSTKTFWKEVRETRATVIQYVGETCRYLMVAPPEIDPVTGENLDKKHRVRVAMGNGLRPDVWGRFQERFGIDTIYEYYAATEGALGFWNPSRNSFGEGAIGRHGVLSGTINQLRSALVLIDHETDQPWRDPKTGFCRRVAAGEPGEFIVRLPPNDIKKRFQGYYGNEAATSSKILRNVFKKGDAWFRSGDLLRWDSDGRVYFHDRIGDTFRWKSENVSTTEVAQVLGLHPAVQEVNVYGVQLPNHDGRAGCAAVVLDSPPPPPSQQQQQQQQQKQKVSAELLTSLAAHARARLPRYAVPLFVRLLREVGMQTTGTYKQQKHVLRQQGVDPSSVGDDALFWLKDGVTYVPFTKTDWKALQAGVVKL